MSRLRTNYFITYYPAAGAVGLLLSAGVMWAMYGSVFRYELLLGWVLAQLNGVAAHFLHRKIIHAKSSRVFSVSLALNILRFATLLLLVFLVYWYSHCRFIPFFLAVLISYGCLVVSQVLSLHSEASREGASS